MKDKLLSMTGNARIDRMLLGDPEDKDDSLPPENPEDVWEAPTGYLRCARHQVFSMILIRKDKVFQMIPYSAIESGSGTFNGDRFTFQFWKGEAAYEASLEGTITHLQRVVDKIAAGKAEMIRANNDEIRSITWEPVAEAEEEK